MIKCSSETVYLKDMYISQKYLLTASFGKQKLFKVVVLQIKKL